MWIAATGTLLSAYFILAANAWMQHPVGSHYNPVTRQDELDSFAKVLFNPAQLAGFPHVIAGCFLTAGSLVAGVALWQILRPGVADSHALAFRHALKAGAITAIVAAVAVVITGDTQGKLFTTQYQPMKMAAAEALYHTAQPAPFSLFTIGSLNGTQPVFEIDLPRLLSFLATGNWSAKVQGIDNLQAQYQAQFGPGYYIPYVPVIYWSFRADGRRRTARRADRDRGAVGDKARADARARHAGAMAQDADRLGDRLAAAAAARQLDGLDHDRDGPPAVGGLRPAEDGRRRIAELGG